MSESDTERTDPMSPTGALSLKDMLAFQNDINDKIIQNNIQLREENVRVNLEMKEWMQSMFEKISGPLLTGNETTQIISSPPPQHNNALPSYNTPPPSNSISNFTQLMSGVDNHRRTMEEQQRRFDGLRQIDEEIRRAGNNQEAQVTTNETSEQNTNRTDSKYSRNSDAPSPNDTINIRRGDIMEYAKGYAQYLKNQEIGDRGIGSESSTQFFNLRPEMPFGPTGRYTEVGIELQEKLPYPQTDKKDKTFLGYSDVTGPRIMRGPRWTKLTEKQATTKISKTKVVIGTDPAKYTSWLQYINDCLTASFLGIMTHMNHVNVPSTREGWLKFDRNCESLPSYAEASSIMVTHSPELSPDAHIVTQNQTVLLLFKALPIIIHQQFILLRDSIHSNTQSALRGGTTSIIDTIQIRIMYFGIKKYFLRSATGPLRSLHLKLLRCKDGMLSSESPDDFASRLTEQITQLNLMAGKAMIDDDTKQNIFTTTLKSATTRFNRVIDQIEGEEYLTQERLEYQPYVARIQDTYLNQQNESNLSFSKLSDRSKTLLKRNPSCSFPSVWFQSS